MTKRIQGRQHGLTADDARVITERVLNISQADNARVSIRSGRRGFVRCADNRITTAGGSTDVTVNIVSVFGQRVASVTTNRLDDDQLTDAVRRSESLARIAPENPEYLSELGQQTYLTNQGYYSTTGDINPDSLAQAAAQEIHRAEAADAVAAGYIDVRAGSQTMATSNGLFAHHA